MLKFRILVTHPFGSVRISSLINNNEDTFDVFDDTFILKGTHSRRSLVFRCPIIEDRCLLNRWHNHSKHNMAKKGLNTINIF